MQKPASLSEFKNLIDGMQHRERFVFTADSRLAKKYNQSAVFIEVYNTILWESKSQDRNITVYLVDSEGNPLVKKAKIHRLWEKDKYYENTYVMLSNSIETIEVAERAEVLELPE